MGELENTVEGRLDAVAELRRTLGALTVAASSADRSVTVQVDMNGRLTGLSLTAEAVSRGHECLAEQIMHAVWAGQWQIAAQVEQMVNDAISRDPELAGVLRRAYDVRDDRPL